LLAGEMLPFAGLNPRQKAAIEAFVFDQEDRDFTGNLMPSLDHYGLETEEVARLKQLWSTYDGSGLPKGDPSDRLPNGIPPDARISLYQSVGNGLVMERQGGVSWPMSELDAIVTGYYKPDAAYKVKPAKEHRYTMTVVLREGYAAGHQMHVTAAGEGEFRSYSELDEATRKRLEQAYKLRHKGGE
jgi:hypothetical protein